MKPVILLGEGARGSDIAKVMRLGCPVLTTWPAIELVDNTHPHYFGRPGLYGQRLANKVLYEADEVHVIGARLSVWTIGYGEWTKAKKITVCDIDKDELNKNRSYARYHGDAKQYIERLEAFNCFEWLEECKVWAKALPWVESPTHDDPEGRIHSHRFVERLQKFFTHDEIIVTDMGSAMVSAYQVLKIVPPQRLISSLGLGEMGVGLPAAIGASFGANKKRVICLHCDGGLMMNIQELQTIIHHKLPIKIFIFDNRGYEMIKGTQRNLKMDSFCVDEASGVSFPDYRRLATAWGFAATDIYAWDDFEREVPPMLINNYPSVAVFHMDEKQPLLPKLMPILNPDGTISPPRYDQLSPTL